MPNFLAAAARAPRSQPFDRITPPTSQNSAVTSDIAPPRSRSRDPDIVSETGDNALRPWKIYLRLSDGVSSGPCGMPLANDPAPLKQRMVLKNGELAFLRLG